MLSYESVYNAPVDELKAAVDAWSEQVGKLKSLEADMNETVLMPVQTCGWTGQDASAAISFIDQTSQEFADAVAQATGIRDILQEAHDAIRTAKERLHTIAETEAPDKGLKVSGSGEVEADSWIPGSDWWNEEEIQQISLEIDRARVNATEADDNAAAALRRNVAEDHDFNAPTHQTLAEAEAAISEGRFNKAEKLMFDEMMRNVGSDEVKEMRENLDSKLTTPEAFLDWFNQVKTGAEWDHKPILEEELGLEVQQEYNLKIPGDPEGRSVSYDMWSNIHYGYVGAAAGFDAETLIQGASISEGATGRDDAGDQVTMRAGIELYEKYGDDLTQEQFHQEMIKTIDKMEDQGAPQVDEWEARKYE
ncbi:polymorphic toxin type 44 domain-containing protein [Saccharopolyspora cebuensis]|uniref:Polymorphic toxin type 44 domain-containing protein n=1 Tax=Saccharopolyspora cebuensis TaxID=418759 RepID=A0ABV4CKQ9_9PSEU